MSRPLFQGINGLVAVATLGLGGMQLVLGVESPMYGSGELPSMPALDSNLRFLGGLALGLAVVMLWALPSIERRADVVAVFWGCAFVGGFGRLLSVFLVGMPPLAMLAFAVVEVAVAPLMLMWFHRLPSRSAS